MEDKRYEGEGGAGVLHSKRETRLSSEGTQAGGVRGQIHSADRCGIYRSRDAAGRAAPGVRATKSSESKKEE